MAQEHAHHSSQSSRRRRRKPQHHDEETEFPQTEEEITGVVNESHCMTDFAWSNPVPDPEGGFNYQARPRVDGSWEYAISGASAVAAASYPRYPSTDFQGPRTYEPISITTPYAVAGDDPGQIQYPNGYTHTHQRLAVEEYENGDINIVTNDTDDRRPGRVPIRITIDLGSSYEATHTRERSAVGRNSIPSRKRDDRRHGDKEKRHRMRNHGDAHRRHQKSQRVDSRDEDVDLVSKES
ncbi:hypothetical protein F4779DRAFT_581679 [Xylariaceae sp. FL0662B]|nr:hypothetical protein F4779DRAFT_581679 [Xylariaceae sp. FL0662B]